MDCDNLLYYYHSLALGIHDHDDHDVDLGQVGQPYHTS